MSYLQLDQDGNALREIKTGDLIEWDENNFCTVEALIKDGKADQFNVVSLIPVEQPIFNRNTHYCIRDDVEKIDGQWYWKWLVKPMLASHIEYQLKSAKDAKNLEINSWRAQANQSTFTHQGKEIACDALSRSDIDAVASHIALTGSFPQNFPMAWKAVDNQYILLPDVAAFKAMYSSMTKRGADNFEKAQNLKTALKNATTLEQIEAIQW